MFTGIIKDVGTVSNIEKKNETFKLAIKLNQLKNAQINLGDSIAVNGTCLTVTEVLADGFAVLVKLCLDVFILFGDDAESTVNMLQIKVRLLDKLMSQCESGQFG